MEPIGKAYGVFDCQASTEEIESVLESVVSSLRDDVPVLSNLELTMVEELENLTLKGDNNLKYFAQKAKEAGFDYIFEVTYEGVTNKETAPEVEAILNQAYQSSLFSKEEPFIADIFYEENGEYVFKD